jgi:purine-binding chemotaxis protein CheW
MKEHPYLTFQLCNRLYGISVNYVEEIFLLPELTQVSVSHALIGILNLRGEMLPILNLSASLGYPPCEYRLTDSIVVLKQAQIRVGMLVNQVYGIKNISAGELTTQFSQDQQFPNIEQSIISAIAINEEIFILNALEKWVHRLEIDSELQETAQSPLPQIDFYPHATPQERAVLRARANSLNQSVASNQIEELNTLAVIELSNQIFGIDLRLVKEFIDVRQVTPIPCAPAHFIGNMNLRGEILTLIDLHRLLNLPSKKFRTPAKVMVVENEGSLTGMIVDSIRNAMFLLNPQELSAASNAINIHSRYLQGIVPYQDQPMYVLDLPALFSKELQHFSMA